MPHLVDDMIVWAVKTYDIISTVIVQSSFSNVYISPAIIIALSSLPGSLHLLTFPGG